MKDYLKKLFNHLNKDDKDKLDEDAIAKSNIAETRDQGEDTIYIEDITGTLGNWLDDNFDKSVPQNVIDAINNAYVLARDYLCDDVSKKGDH